MKTNQYILTKPDGTERYFSAASDSQGYLYNYNQKPFVNSEAMEKAGLRKEEVLEMTRKGTLLIKHPEICLKVGENVHGYFVESKEHRRVRDETILESSIRGGSTAVEFKSKMGLGLVITQRLPKGIWNIISSSHRTYNNGSEEEMEWLDDQMPGYYTSTREVRGWYYAVGAIADLLRAGIKVSYYGSQVLLGDTPILQQLNDIEEADKKSHETQKAETKRLKSEFHAFFSSVPDNNPTEEECKLIAELPRIMVFTHQGPTLNGGGSWLHKDKNHFYYVRNNGGDGDAWDWNNYPTSGAGAICQRVPLKKEHEEWLKQAAAYDKQYKKAQ